ncbi:acyltransferase family-domain-containing protein [Xylariaceae sp. FL0016]|nr:acyltransferase family-domain-containing protein [Xylariaceae sp. FL0016]
MRRLYSTPRFRLPIPTLAFFLSIPTLLMQAMPASLRPSQESASPSNPNPKPPRRKLHPTSYLDGLRGLAAVVVCVCHYTENHHGYLTPFYGAHGWPDIPDRNGTWVSSSPVQLPFVRIVFSGRPMVHIFFVVSGFALSYRALRELRVRNWARFHAVLSSSAFRRPIRLLGPPVVSTLGILGLIRMGWLYPPRATLGEQVVDWWHAVYYHILWPWGWDRHLWPPYDVHLWTIPIELCHSMLLFLVVLLLSRVRYGVRLLCSLGFLAYALHCGKWAAFEFVGGMVLAEQHLVSTEQAAVPPRARVDVEMATSLDASLGSSEFEKDATSQGKPKGETAKRLEKVSHVVSIVAFLYIGGWPNSGSDETPGIRYLRAHTPASFPIEDPEGPQKFWFALCAMCVVWTSGRLDVMKRTLESRRVQYTGRISFAVYLMHGPVLGRAYDPESWIGAGCTGLRGFFGTDTTLGRTACWASGIVVLAPLVWVAAHLFCVYVDEPMVHLARRVEAWCLVADGDGSGSGSDVTGGKAVVSVKGGCLEGLDWGSATHIWTKSAMVPIPEGSETHSEGPSESEYCSSINTLDQPTTPAALPRVPEYFSGSGGGFPPTKGQHMDGEELERVKASVQLGHV